VTLLVTCKRGTRSNLLYTIMARQCPGTRGLPPFSAH
jgi:hypothetical protein